MSGPQLRILVVEDDQQFKELIWDIIEQTGDQSLCMEHAGTLKEAFDLLEGNSFDVVLLDLHLPDSFGLETVSRMYSRQPQIPIVVLTGQKDEEYARQALEAGAQEFLLKEEVMPGLLGRAIRYAVERKQAQDRLRESEQRQKAILDSVQVGILVIDPEEHIIVDANPAALTMVGKSREQIIGRLCHNFVCPAQEKACPITDNKQDIDLSERELIGPDGSLIPILKTVTTITLGGKEHLLESFLDITQIKQARVVLEQSRHDLEREVIKRTGELQRAKTQWERTFDAVPDLITLVDRDHRIIRSNRAAAERLGLQPRDMVGKKCHVLLHDTEAPPANCPHQRLLGDGAEHTQEMYEKSIEADLLITTSPLRDEDGVLYASVHVARDISDLKAAQKHLREQLAFMHSLVEAIPFPLYIKNRQGVYTECNQAFADLKKMKKSQIMGLNIYGITAKELADEHTRRDQELWKNGGTQTYESRVMAGGDKRYDAIFSKAVFNDSQGAPVGIVGVMVDITDRKSMERQLIKSQRLDAIGQLAAGIAHEINTPTQFIHTNVEFLEESCQTLLELAQYLPTLQEAIRSGQPTEKLLETLDKMIGKADLGYLSGEISDALAGSMEGIGRIAAIVDSMRYFAHPGTEEKAPIDVNKALEHAITVSRNEWKYYADIETDFAEDLPLMQGYAAPFNQVLLNLIVNAAQAISQELGETPEQKGIISVSTRAINDIIEIRIADNGPGIDPDILPKIFDPFFTTKNVGQGTGQGLAQVNAVVVEKHGGRVDVETEVGKGTTFIIQLPVGE